MTVAYGTILRHDCQVVDDNPYNIDQIRAALRRVAERESPRHIAKQVGVSHTTIYRLIGEDEISPPNPVTLRALARYLESVVDTERGGVSHATDGGGVPDYIPNTQLAQRAPPRARDVGLGYISRLARAGVPHDEIERFERQLFDDRFAIQFSRRHHEEWSEEDWIAHMNSVWLHATDWLLPRGIVP